MVKGQAVGFQSFLESCVISTVSHCVAVRPMLKFAMGDVKREGQAYAPKNPVRMFGEATTNWLSCTLRMPVCPSSGYCWKHQGNSGLCNNLLKHMPLNDIGNFHGIL